MTEISSILAKVASGELTPAAAELQLRPAAQDLGFATLDLDRERRCGHAEVIYCPGKTTPQVLALLQALAKAGQHAMATRATPEVAAAVRAAWPDVVYHETARMLTFDAIPLPRPAGSVAIVAAGTSDLPVAEEAALVAERLGAAVERVFDVGVAGLHRLGRQLDRLRQANVLVVVAGMEGALPSVVGGLVAKPIIAVPTSIGYGTGQGGYAALLSMLNSCVAGITVVNIDNGFGAGVAAALINRLALEGDGPHRR